MNARTFRLALLGAVILILLTGCKGAAVQVSEPYEHQTVSYDVDFIVYAGSKDPVILEVLTNGQWVEIGEVTYQRGSDIPSGQWESSQPLYQLTNTLTVFSEGTDNFKSHVVVRARAGADANYLVFPDSTARDCTYRQNQLTFSKAYNQCTATPAKTMTLTLSCGDGVQEEWPLEQCDCGRDSEGVLIRRCSELPDASSLCVKCKLFYD